MGQVPLKRLVIQEFWVIGIDMIQHEKVPEEIIYVTSMANRLRSCSKREEKRVAKGYEEFSKLQSLSYFIISYHVNQNHTRAATQPSLVKLGA